MKKLVKDNKKDIETTSLKAFACDIESKIDFLFNKNSKDKGHNCLTLSFY